MTKILSNKIEKNNVTTLERVNIKKYTNIMKDDAHIFQCIIDYIYFKIHNI